MAFNLKRSLSKRFSIKLEDSSSRTSPGANSSSTPFSKRILKPATSKSNVQPTTSTTSVTNNLAKVGLPHDEQASPKRRSISKATISPPKLVEGLQYVAGSPTATPNPPCATSKPPTFHSRRISEPLLTNTTVFASDFSTLDINRPVPHTSGVTIVECGVPTNSTSSSTNTASQGAGIVRPASAPLTMLKESVPIPFNPSLPAYLLDRIHPCIPLPAPWNCEHDQYIVSLDVQDYHLPAIVRRLKQRFPELRAECVTPGMVDKRLRILDLRVDWQGWKRAISTMPPTGHIDDFDSSFDELSATSFSTGLPKANAKKVLTNVANRARHPRRVSTGGMSGKITINKRGTSVANLSVDTSAGTNSTHIHRYTSSSGSASSFLVLNKGSSSITSPSSVSWFDATPSTPSTTLTVPEMAAEQLSHTRDFAAESFKSMERREWTTRGSNVAKDKGKGRMAFANQTQSRREVIGVPSVMRTTSGRPVLR